MNIFRKILFLILPLLTALGLFSGCHRSEGYHSVGGLVWSTSYHIIYKGPAELEDSIKSVLDEVGHSLSVFEPESVVSLANSQKESEVDDHFVKIFMISQKVHRLSGGMFDPTIAPLIDAWGFGKGHQPTMDTLRIDSLMNLTGLDKCSLQEKRLIKEHPGLRFNFSAVAKGYGCDAVGEMFKRNGVRNYMVEIGGEVKTAGLSPQQRKWRIGVESPSNYTIKDSLPGRPPKPEFAEFVSISGEGVATSSNLRNIHNLNSQQTGHIISPKTGYPVKAEIESATVVAKSCAEADALATASIAMPLKEAEAMIQEANVGALLMTADTVIRINWEPYLTK